MDVQSLQLSNESKHYSDCCLGISQPLIDKIIALLPHKPGLVLSIGCGSGLFEAVLIQHAQDKIDLVGVEVSSTVDKYLGEQNIIIADGTWALHEKAQSAAAWMFVYPREPKLLAKYIDTYASEDLKVVMWLGPRNDWPDYADVFEQYQMFHVQMIEDCGLAGYEIMAVAAKR